MAADCSKHNHTHSNYQPNCTVCACCVCSLHQRSVEFGSEYLCSFLRAHISDESGTPDTKRLQVESYASSHIHTNLPAGNFTFFAQWPAR